MTLNRIPDFGGMPEHEIQKNVGLMSDTQIQEVMTKPGAYDIRPREDRIIRKEKGWRDLERTIAAHEHDKYLKDAGFTDGFSVDISKGIPDEIADPLPDTVVNHVDDVTQGRFRPKKVASLPEDVKTPETSPLDNVPFADYKSVNPDSVNTSKKGVSVKFEVKFETGIKNDFRSEFKTK